MILDILAFSCPLILASLGALFSEYVGTLALFLEGLIGFSAFLAYTFSTILNSTILGFIFTTITTTLLLSFITFIIEKSKANKFIAALGLNILFTSSISLISSLIFKTRGTLTSEVFTFTTKQTQLFSIIFTALIVIITIIFLLYSQKGIYIRITGTNSDLLNVKGINPSIYRIVAWGISAFFASFSGFILAMRVSAFVPGLSGGKGWMALAAVFLGKKKWWLVIIFVVVFCAVDYLSAGIQNYIKAIPSSVVLALPYLVILLLLSIKKVI